MNKQLCRCGCGQEVKEGNIFIRGHQRRGKPSPIKGRKFPIDKYPNFGARNKTFPVDKYPNHGTRGKKHTEEWKKEASKRISGKNNPFYGRKHTEETKRKISEAKLGHASWNKGKHLSEKHRKKLGETLKRNYKEGKRIPPWLGKHRSDDTKRKISGILKMLYKEGKIRVWCKGLTKETDERVRMVTQRGGETRKRLYKEGKLKPPMLGKKFSLELRKKLSEIHKTKTGEKSSHWKGGITSLVLIIRHSWKMDEWRKLVFERDKYICQECQQWGGRLVAHHIKSFSSIMLENNIKTLGDALNCQKLWDISNGITLCKDCHRQVNFKEKDWENYLQSKLQLPQET